MVLFGFVWFPSTSDGFSSCNATHVPLASRSLPVGFYFSNSSLPRRILLVYKEAQLEKNYE
jgi:hypothetical protein